MQVSIRDPLSIGRFLAARSGEPILISDSDNPLYDAIKRFCTEISIVGRQNGVGPIWRGIKGRNQPIEYPAGNKPFRIVSFHTDDELYTAAAAKLKASADALSIPVHIETVSSRGSWEGNCAFKAEFVRDQWNRSDVPIVWVDADATLNTFPSLFAAVDTDFAIYKRDRWSFNSATLYFGRSPAAAALLDRWVDHCRRNPNQRDQVSLDHAWAEITRVPPLRTVWLPESYCGVFDRAGADKAIIIQWQASRQTKKRASRSAAQMLFVKSMDFVRRHVSGRRRARRASRTRLR